MNDQLKKISSLIGIISTQALVGSMLFYFSFLPYRHSQLKRIDNSLTKDSFEMMMPVAFTSMFLTFYLGIFIEAKTNPRMYEFYKINYLSIEHYLLVIYVLLPQ